MKQVQTKIDAITNKVKQYDVHCYKPKIKHKVVQEVKQFNTKP